MYEYIKSLLYQYVEIDTYLSKNKLYGEIIKVNHVEVTLLRKHHDKAINDNYNLCIPISSIISVRKL